MRKVSKALALLMALLMIVSAMPMAVFAEAAGPTQKVVFDLVVDGNDQNDLDVAYPDDMGEVPAGKDLYNGVTPAGIKLDWDAWQTIFPDDDMTSNQDISFSLLRETAKSDVVSEGDLESVGYGDPEKISIISDDRKVKVLNVYPIPESEGLLRQWLELAYEDVPGGYTKHFEIKTVLLDAKAAQHAGVAAPEKTFNVDYAEFIAEGYDVIFFGTSDGNGDLASVEDDGVTKRTFYDLSKDAYDAVDAYIQNGHGVLFGHDTVCSADHLDGDGSDGDGFDYFTEFADELDIVCLEGEAQKEVSQKGNEITDKIKVENRGLLTSYPFTIDENLTVPKTHSLLQKVSEESTATVWMTLQDSAEDDDSIYHLGKEFSAYLLTNKNVAMIQTGHSSHDDKVSSGAHKQEGQVIANTLFYLMQKSIGDYSTDGNFIDKADPVIDKKASASITDLKPTDGSQPQYFKADVEISASDLGTGYKYSVEAKRDDRTVAESNKLQLLAISNLKGYMVEITDSETLIGAANMAKERENSEDPTKREIIVDVESNGAPTSEVITFNTGDVKSGKDGLKVVPGDSYWVHIVPVDNANRYGNEIAVEINFDELYQPNVETEIETVIPEDDKIPEDSRVEVVTSTDAEGNPVIDEEGKPVTETTTYYYPGNYLDKDGNEFDERQEDTEIEFKTTTSVDAKDREVIGTLVITDKEGNVIKTIENIEATPSYGYPIENELKVSIDEIYPEEKYTEDGEFTATITWNDKATGEEVAEDECKIIIKRPDYKVDITYKVDDGNTKVSEVTETQYVKHGDKAKAPDAPSRVYGSDYRYDFKQWNDGKQKYNFPAVTSDKVIKASYDKVVRNPGHDDDDRPTIPEEPVKPDTDVELIRLGGKTRIETAIEISKEGWDKSKVVILATANLFPDAMAGVPLAKAVDAPILLTVNGESLEKVVKDEIARLNPEKVYILGQTAAVNANIEKELKALYEVERVGGKDRFGTSAEIAYELEEIYGEKADAVYFVRSDEFPDALSVSAVAAIEHNPILYIAPNGQMDVDVAEYAKTIGTDATIIGGEAAVNSVGEASIKALFKNVDRIYGKDRYATSVAICTAKDALFTGDATSLATGKKFPDALTGGAFAAKKNIPVLLVNGNVSPELVKYLSTRPIATLYVFGGEAAVSTRVAYEALGHCKYIGD